MLLFGHTSDYRWNHNEFGQIFRNITKLTNGHDITIIWNNHKYTYRVIEQRIIKPKDVAKVYAEYHDDEKKYLTLVGCYPIGTARDRIIVIAELIDVTAIDNNEADTSVVQLARFP
jgi:LPXTG-site transpeptidase (sortase) family protein